MKALIIGASGLVGSHLMEAGNKAGWQLKGTYYQLAQPGLNFLELTDSQAVSNLLQGFQPNIIFLPAFRSHVDYCEENPEETYQINVTGSLNVIKVARETGAKLIFYSSDYVFDGEKGPYREVDTPNPICEYGRQKLEIEQRIAQLLETYLILRITVVYGYESQRKNFVNRLIDTLQAGKEIKVPVDQIGSPTLVNDIAEASFRLVEAGAEGIFHVSGADVMSRYDFALKVAEMFNLPMKKILSVTTPELKQPAARPLKAGMVCDKLTTVLNWNLKGVIEGISYFKQTQLSNDFSLDL